MILQGTQKNKHGRKKKTIHRTQSNFVSAIKLKGVLKLNIVLLFNLKCYCFNSNNIFTSGNLFNFYTSSLKQFCYSDDVNEKRKI